MKSRPPPQKLRQRGILRERVFGCDLGEHLHNSGHEGKLFQKKAFLNFILSCYLYLPAVRTEMFRFLKAPRKECSANLLPIERIVKHC